MLLWPMALNTVIVEDRENLFLKNPVFCRDSFDRKAKGKKKEIKNMMKVRLQNRLFAIHSYCRNDFLKELTYLFLIFKKLAS